MKKIEGVLIALKTFFLHKDGGEEGFIKEIENRFSLTLTLSIVFTTLAAYLLKIEGKEAIPDPNKTLLRLGMLVFFYLLAYCLFQLIKNRLGRKVLRLISYSVFGGILSFLVPMGFLVFSKDQTVEGLGAMIFQTSLFILLGFPFAFFLVLIIFSYLLIFL